MHDCTRNNGGDLSEEATKQLLLKDLHNTKLNNPFIHAFISYVAKVPSFRDQLRQLYDRREQFLTAYSQTYRGETLLLDKIASGDKIQLLSPLISLAATNVLLRDLFLLCLEKAAQKDSERIKNNLPLGQNYHPLVLIGAGLHSQIFNAEFLANRPDIVPLSIEVSDKLGGQFSSGGSSFALNTSNYPINAFNENTPTDLNPNFFGEHAPVQLQQISGKMFASNETIGLAGAFNQYCSANTLLGCKVLEVKENRDTQQRGMWEIQVINQKDNQTFSIFSDVVIPMTGQGEASMGIRNPDQTTEAVLAQDKATADLAKRLFLTFPESNRAIGGDHNPFGREIFKDQTVVIIGGGHGMLTTIERIVGLGGDPAAFVTALGAAKKIIVINSKYETADEMRAKEYARYSAVSILIGSEKVYDGTKEALVTMIPGVHVTGFDVIGSGKDKQAIVRYKEKGSEQDTELSVTADRVIATTGFTNSIDKLFPSLIDAKVKIISSSDNTRANLVNLLDEKRLTIHFSAQMKTDTNCERALCDEAGNFWGYQINGEIIQFSKKDLATALKRGDISCISYEDSDGKYNVCALESEESIKIFAANVCYTEGTIFECLTKRSREQQKILAKIVKEDEKLIAQLSIGNDLSKIEVEQLMQQFQSGEVEIHCLYPCTPKKIPGDLMLFTDKNNSGDRIARSLSLLPNIFIAGTAALVPVESEEALKNNLFRAPNNPVGINATNRDSRTLARYVATLFENRPIEKLARQDLEELSLPSLGNEAKVFNRFSVEVYAGTKTHNLSREVNLKDLAEILLSGLLSDQSLDLLVNKQAIKVEIRLVSDSKNDINDGRQIALELSSGITKNEKEKLIKIFSDQLLQTCLLKQLKFGGKLELPLSANSLRKNWGSN